MKKTEKNLEMEKRLKWKTFILDKKYWPNLKKQD